MASNSLGTFVFPGAEFAAPGSSAPADVASVGTAATLARSDHKHGREAATLPATTVGSGTSFGSATVVGTSVNYAREDHNHGTPTAPVTTFSTTGAGLTALTSATGAVSISNTGVTSIVAGTNVTISGGTGAVTINASSGSGTAATTVQSGTTFGLASVVGTLTSFAREDHQHGTPSLTAAISVINETSYGQVANVGTSANYARQDHTHGSPANPVTSLSGSGSGISVTGSTGAVSITNTGVTSVTATTGIGLTATTGSVQISNTGATSVAGRTGAVTLTAADVGAGTFPGASYAFGGNSVLTGTRGAANATTNASGQIIITHGLLTAGGAGLQPASILVTPTSAAFIRVQGWTTTTFTVEVRTLAGAVSAGAVTGFWWAALA